MTRKIKGAIKFTARTTYPANPEEGMMFYNSNSSSLNIYDGTGWQSTIRDITEYDEMDDTTVDSTKWTEDTSTALGGSASIAEEAADYISLTTANSATQNSYGEASVTTKQSYKGKNAAMGFAYRNASTNNNNGGNSISSIQITDGEYNTSTIYTHSLSSGDIQNMMVGVTGFLEWSGDVCKLKYIAEGQKGDHFSNEYFSSSESSTSDCSTWTNVYLNFKCRCTNTNTYSPAMTSVAKVRLLTN